MSLPSIATVKPLPKRYDPDANNMYAWPGPAGWWYVPLFWLIVVLAAELAWYFD